MSWSLLQNVPKTSSGSVSTLAVTIGAVSAGQLIVLSISGFHTTSSPAVADTLGNTYTKGETTNQGNPNIFIFYSVATNGGTPTITYTPGVANFLQMECDVWSAAGAITVGTGNTNTAASGTSLTAGSASWGAGSPLLIAAFMNLSTTGSFTADTNASGTTINSPGLASNYEALFVEYYTAETSPYNPSATAPSSTNWCGACIPFLDAGSSGKLFTGFGFDGLSVGGPFFSNPLGRI